jgi:hypothetical protein
MASELIGPLCGLAGVAVGAAATSLGAFAASRRAWNTDQVKATNSFHEEVIAAAHSQLILLTLLRDRLRTHVQQLQSRVAEGHELSSDDGDYLHDKNHVSRLETATDEWRAVLARRFIYADEGTSKAIKDLDNDRAAVTAALNIGEISETDDALQAFNASLALLYKEIRRRSLEMNVVLVNSFFAWPWNVRVRRQHMKDLESLD